MRDGRHDGADDGPLVETTRRGELGAYVTEMTAADEKTIERAIRTASALPPIVECTDDTSLHRMPAPPAPELRERVAAIRKQLKTVRFDIAAGKYPEGLELATKALASAQEIGWGPLVARARVLEGELLRRNGKIPEGEKASFQGYSEAAKLGQWEIAAVAGQELGQVLERVGGEDGQVAAVDHVAAEPARLLDQVGEIQQRQLWQHAEVSCPLQGGPRTDRLIAEGHFTFSCRVVTGHQPQ